MASGLQTRHRAAEKAITLYDDFSYLYRYDISGGITPVFAVF